MKIEFLHPMNALFIILGGFIGVIFYLGYKKKRHILHAFHLSYIKGQVMMRVIIFCIGLSLIVFSLMGPMYENGYRDIKGNGLEVYILIDTSKSMLTEDILPSRIERGKHIISELLKSLNGDRVGFIPFSSSAYIQMPLTDDYTMANMFLDVMDTDMISGGGSNVTKAINLALESFSNTPNGDHVILIISDGEEHDAKSIEAVKSIKNSNTKIFTIGVGTTQGGLIPEYNDAGTTKTGYKKDDQGHAITSKLDEELLQQLAKETNGAYYQSTIGLDEVSQVIQDFAQLNKAAFEVKKIKEYKQLYPYFLGVGILLLLLALILPERRLSND